MFTNINGRMRSMTGAVAAGSLVALAGLTWMQGALPRGTVEVGEMTPVGLVRLAEVTLPEVVVTGRRIGVGRLAATLPSLPEVVVVASREVGLAAMPGSEPAQG